MTDAPPGGDSPSRQGDELREAAEGADKKAVKEWAAKDITRSQVLI